MCLVKQWPFSQSRLLCEMSFPDEEVLQVPLDCPAASSKP